MSEPATTPLVVSWTPDPADMHEVLGRVSYRRQRSKILLLFALMVLAGGLIAVKNPAPGGTVVLVGLTMFVLFAIGIPARRSMGRVWKANPMLTEATAMEFGPDGVIRRTLDFEGRWGWRLVEKVEETPGAFFLSFGNQPTSAMLLVPKRAFAGAEEIARFRELLRRYRG
jgi:YcxB-like protein